MWTPRDGNEWFVTLWSQRKVGWFTLVHPEVTPHDTVRHCHDLMEWQRETENTNPLVKQESQKNRRYKPSCRGICIIKIMLHTGIYDCYEKGKWFRLLIFSFLSSNLNFFYSSLPLTWFVHFSVTHKYAEGVRPSRLGVPMILIIPVRQVMSRVWGKLSEQKRCTGWKIQMKKGGNRRIPQKNNTHRNCGIQNCIGVGFPFRE